MELKNAKLMLKNPLRPELLPVEVDTRADSDTLHLCIPPFVRLQLSLEVIAEREIILADGSKKIVPYVGPVEMHFKNRVGFTGAVVLGEEVLLGSIPMDDMDLAINEVTEMVDVNPESPDIAMSVVEAGPEDEDEEDEDEDEEDEYEEDEDGEDEDIDEQFARIDAILGESKKQSFNKSVKVYFEHLRRSLTLPCIVTGIEDFRWEEFYVIGPGKPGEYNRLRKTQPSYQDDFELLSIDLDSQSEWMPNDEDIAAHVRRKSDKKKFILGLSELEAVDDESPNHQLLDDYSVFFVNYA